MYILTFQRIILNLSERYLLGFFLLFFFKSCKVYILACFFIVDFSAGSSLKHRQVKHYGYEFNYEINNVDPRKPLKEGIPEICHEFLKQALDSKLIARMPDQLTVNQYLAGQGKIFDIHVYNIHVAILFDH